MKPKDNIKNLKDVLLKLAQGFSYTETTEEFVPTKDSGQIGMQELEVKSEEQAGLKLSKKKIVTHYVPPDMLAIKMLLQYESGDDTQYSQMTDEQLLELKNKLLGQLMEGEQ